MTLRSLLLAIGIPLVVLPMGVSFLFFSGKMAESDEAARRLVLEIRLELVMQQISSAWGVSARVGFAQSDFYRLAVIRSLGNPAVFEPDGGGVAVLDERGLVVVGPESWKGRAIGALNPWRPVLEHDGTDVLGGPFLDSAARYLTAHRKFLPWDWTVVTFLDQSLVWKTVSRSLTLSILFGLGFLVLTVALLWYLTYRVTRPLVELQEMAIRMGHGDFDRRVVVSGPLEVATLGREWNSMADRIQGLTRDLEQRVSDRTRDLEDALERTKAMQDQLILSEKMASLGQLVAGIAHELNTPLAAIESARATLDELFGPNWDARVEALTSLSTDSREKLWTWVQQAEANTSLDSGRNRRLRKELAARFRQAGVLDPEGAADRLAEVGLVEWSQEDLAYLGGSEGLALMNALADLVLIRMMVALVGTALSKADRVIGSLRIYSRHDPSREAALVSLAASLDGVLLLFQNRLKSGIDLVRNLPEDLLVLADADRLGQLWTNLIGNALGAMGNRGRLELKGERVGPNVVMEVIDSGPGIPPEHQPKIFTPFFTTKKPGEGSGLGLSICLTIVQEARGTLTFESQPGRTVFQARFPCP